MSDETTGSTEEIVETTEETTPTEETQGGSLLSGVKTGSETEGEAAEQSTDEVKEEGETKAKENEEGEPVEYEEFTLPESLQANEALMSEFTELAKGAGLPQDQAQGFIDLLAKQKAQESEAQEKQEEAWRKEVTDVPEYEKMLGNVKRGVLKYADEDTQALLDQTWVGSHPGVLAMLDKAFAHLAEGSAFIEGESPAAAEVSMADRMYAK